jgi:ubiquinone/menaquinone biosynthesis C-methylase UbiE
MSIITRTTNALVSMFSLDRFYSMMNKAYKVFHDQYYMLHYPFYQNDEDDFFQSQKNLTNHCLSKISPLSGKTVLDVGCGNGIQGLHISQDHKPGKYIGIDISAQNIKIAKDIQKENGNENMVFHIDNAQEIAHIEDDSIDVVINIESALHYPDKMKFLKEIYRVLKPGGEFMIADVLATRKQKKESHESTRRWGIFHHWTLEEYHQSFPFADLTLTSTHDISEAILKGFQNYKHWFKDKRSKGFLKRWTSDMFIFINAKVYSFMYARTRAYYIFAGTKPVQRTLLNS